MSLPIGTATSLISAGLRQNGGHISSENLDRRMAQALLRVREQMSRVNEASSQNQRGIDANQQETSSLQDSAENLETESQARQEEAEENTTRTNQQQEDMGATADAAAETATQATENEGVVEREYDQRLDRDQERLERQIESLLWGGARSNSGFGISNSSDEDLNDNRRIYLTVIIEWLEEGAGKASNRAQAKGTPRIYSG